MIADAAILELPKFSLQTKELLPEYSGIYYVVDEANTVWYIGKAKNIRKRWQGKNHHRIYQLEAQKKKHFTLYCEPVNESQLDTVEKQRIDHYQPHLNDSPVKTKKVHPTETLLRETIGAIANFAFILGVEPPRKEIESQINSYWLGSDKILGLSVIHICLDDVALNSIYQPASIEESSAIIAKAFTTRKTYANKWELFRSGGLFLLRLRVNSYAIEVVHWNFWSPKEEPDGLREYSQQTLAKESIRALTPDALNKLKNLGIENKNYALYLQRLTPYTSDLINLFFNESVDSEASKKGLAKISEDYKTGRRGIGSRSQPINSLSLEDLLISRGIDPEKYKRSEVRPFRGDRIGLYIKCFSVDLKSPIKKIKFNDKIQTFINSAHGILNNQQEWTLANCFDTVYLLAGVEKKGWLLVEEYLQGFARPATALSNGEGFMEKAYISERKFIAPAKVNIKLESIGYSIWIPFGPSPEFSTFETATQEIRRRLKDSGLPALKITFKKESIEKK